MQFTGSCRVVNGSAFVEFLYVATFANIVGTFFVGDTLTFGSGAVGELLAINGNNHTFVITSTQQPVVGDTVASDDSPATATADISAYVTSPDIVGFGVTAGAWFIRDGDQVAYVISSVFSRSRLQLVAPYGGASNDAADGLIHNTRTPVKGYPAFDRRDRNLPVLLNVLVTILDGE